MTRRQAINKPVARALANDVSVCDETTSGITRERAMSVVNLKPALPVKTVKR
jgi:hypothetical protein